MRAFASPAAAATEPRPPLLPNPPSTVSLAQDTSGGLIATWTASAIDSVHDAAVGYNLHYSPAGAGTWTLIAGVSSPYDLADLAADVAFDVEVQSVNAAGTSGWSATSTLTTAVAVPNAPTAPVLGQGEGSNLVATWTAPAADRTHNPATGYNLRASPSGAGTWTVVTGVNSPYMLQGLAAGTAIDVQVQAVNAAGAGAWSAVSTLTTGAAGPQAPNAPVIASVVPPADGTNSELAVTWTAPATDSTHDAATGYNLRYSPSGAGTWTTVAGVTSPYTITGLGGGAAIDVEVQATNAAPSAGAWSATLTSPGVPPALPGRQ